MNKSIIYAIPQLNKNINKTKKDKKYQSISKTIFLNKIDK